MAAQYNNHNNGQFGREHAFREYYHSIHQKPQYPQQRGIYDDDDTDSETFRSHSRATGTPSRSRSRARSLDGGRRINQSRSHSRGGKPKPFRRSAVYSDYDSDYSSDEDDAPRRHHHRQHSSASRRAPHHSHWGIHNSDSKNFTKSGHSDARSTASTNDDSKSKALIKPAAHDLKPCAANCVDAAKKPSSVSRTHYPHGVSRDFPLPDSDSEYDSDQDAREAKQRRNKRLAYGAITVMATIGAGNALYQNAKGYSARREAIRQGDYCSGERKNQQHKALIQDGIALATVAVGLRNMVCGWQKHSALRKQDHEVRDKYDMKRVRRDRSPKYDGRDVADKYPAGDF